MDFSELTTKWRVLSTMGIIFVIISVFLAVMIALMFYTDIFVWPVENIPFTKNEKEIDDFLNEFEKGPVNTKNIVITPSKEIVKDVFGNKLDIDMLSMTLLVDSTEQ